MNGGFAGASVIAWDNASDGLGFGRAPNAGYDITITPDACGKASVSGYHSSYPNLEIWEYGNGVPKLIYNYSHKGFGPSNLFGGQSTEQ
jgi:hypothetical protein